MNALLSIIQEEGRPWRTLTNSVYSIHQTVNRHMILTRLNDLTVFKWMGGDGSIDQLNQIRTYSHSYDRAGFGLEECGITLIPHESLSLFQQIIKKTMYAHESEQLNQLVSKIVQAQVDKKDMIHFGL